MRILIPFLRRKQHVFNLYHILLYTLFFGLFYFIRRDHVGSREVLQSPSVTPSTVMQYQHQHHSEAIVCVFYADLYILPLLVLSYTLHKFGATKNRDMILLVAPKTINNPDHIRILKELGWIIMYVEAMPFPGEVESRFAGGLVKLYALTLTQYKALGILDADAMLLNTIEEPFRLLRTNSSIYMLAAIDDLSMYFEKDLKFPKFNAGILFLRPNPHHFHMLMKYAPDTSYYSLRFPQQNLLNKYFYNQWTTLPRAYNVQENFLLRFPMWNNLTKTARIMHFSGRIKPWDIQGNTHNTFRETHQIWRRALATLIDEKSWTEEDFLGPGTSAELRANLNLNKLLALQ